MLSWTFLVKKLIFSKRSESLVRKIAWLSIVSISLSTAAFILVLSVMSGMNESIEKRVMGVEPHLVMEPLGDSSLPQLPEKVIALESQFTQVRHYSFERQDVILRTVDGLFRGGIARGVDELSLRRLLHQIEDLDSGKRDRPSAGVGSRISEEDFPGPGEILIGSDLARVLGLFDGDEVSLFQPESLLASMDEAPVYERVKVKKLITTNIVDIDSQVIFYQKEKSLTRFKKSLSLVQGYEFFFTDGNVASQFKSQLGEMSGWKIQTWGELNSALFFALGLEKTMIGIFLGLAALISVSSILTVTALLMSQKRRDIALLKTMGLSDGATLRTFAGIGFLLSMIGIISGGIIGTGISIWIEAHPLQILPDIYYDNTIPARVNMLFVAGVFTLSGIICWFASFLPAKASIEISPAEVLKQ